MGKTITPKHRLVINDGSGEVRQAWVGRATNKDLEEYIFAYAKTLELGGVNEHISKDLGYIPYPKRAVIIEQETNEVKAEWVAPMFMAW